jgi:hypothetical protein
VALKSLFKRRRVTAFVAIAACVAAAPAAFAGTAPTNTCSTDVVLSNPFLPWNDASNYVLAPNGGLEAGGALTGGAAVVTGNETYQVHGKADTRSLSIPAGGSATTATFCLDPNYPTMRFFVAGDTTAALSVDILYTDASGKPAWHQLGKVTPGSAWAPSPVLKLIDKAQQPTAQFRFTAEKGAVRVDDVYIDPFFRR